MGELDNFSFHMPDGNERRRVDGLDNVIWDNGKVCVAVLHEQTDRYRFRMDYGDEKTASMAGFVRKHSEYFDELDPLLFRCIALQWVTHGGNTKHD